MKFPYNIPYSSPYKHIIYASCCATQYPCGLQAIFQFILLLTTRLLRTQVVSSKINWKIFNIVIQGSTATSIYNVFIKKRINIITTINNMEWLYRNNNHNNILIAVIRRAPRFTRQMSKNYFIKTFLQGRISSIRIYPHTHNRRILMDPAHVDMWINTRNSYLSGEALW